MKITDKITITNECNMELMARYPDNYFDLAIVDPNYSETFTTDACKSNKGKKGNYKVSNLNKKTPDEYFDELFRISKNQIIWGANWYGKYFGVGGIVWDKKNDGFSFADGELAWTSFNSAVRFFRYHRGQQIDERIHPTQKPIALYKWLLSNYAKQGDKILDTHLGSGSSRIAAYEMGFDFTAFELDTEYFEAQEKRYKAHIAQLKLELI